jgi:biotin carboxyl carrier protein
MIGRTGDYLVRVIGAEPEATEPASGWSFAWVDLPAGIAVLRPEAGEAVGLVVEGSGSHWFVTLRGRRIAVEVESWRERVLAQAALESAVAGGPIEVTATLPGLIVAIETEEGRDVAAGDPLLTIEAMKMQNEVRAPRAGRISGIAVTAGEKVGTGQLLLRLE